METNKPTTKDIMTKKLPTVKDVLEKERKKPDYDTSNSLYVRLVELALARHMEKENKEEAR